MASGNEESIKRFQEEINRRKKLVNTNLGKAMTSVCQLVENTAKRGMTDTEIDSSKKYVKGKNGTIVHYASQDFSYPAVDTGTLRRSVTHDVERDGDIVTGRVGTAVIYGAYLENGTSKMSPRPWLKPSIAVNREKIHKLLQSVFKNADIGDVE